MSGLCLSGAGKSIGSPVTKDLLAKIFIPQTDLEWGDLGYTSPTSIWSMQDASLGVVDSRAVTFLSASVAPNDPGFRAAEASWTSKSIQLSIGGVSNLSGTNVLTDVSTTSVLFMMFADVTSTATDAVMVTLGGINTGGKLVLTVAGNLKVVSGVNSATGVNTPGSGAVGGIIPLLFKSDKTGALSAAYSTQEVLTVTPGGITGKGVMIGNKTADAQIDVVYACMWTGTAAELSDAAVRTLLQSLGYTVAW